MAAARVVLVAGATGLVGQAVLAALLAAETESKKGLQTAGSFSASVGAVHVIYATGRHSPSLSHSRLHLHAVDFTARPTRPSVDDVYITMGSTIAAAGSQAAFRAVDYDAVTATAHAARNAEATRCGVVTAMGANPHSRIFYNRIKGEVERDLQLLWFTSLVIARPSLLIGERSVLHQAPRRGESVYLKLFKWLDPIIPPNYPARLGTDVGQALVHAVQSAQTGRHVISCQALQAV